MIWRVLTAEIADAPRNMAIDEFMLSWAQNNGLPIARFYQWQPAALSIGYFQRYQKEVDEDACLRRGVDWIRRPTGGRAVLHQHEITYAVALPAGLPGVPQGILPSYRWLSQGLIRGLNALGVPAQIAPGQRLDGPASAACFDSPSRYELTASGRKIVGSAQVRRSGTLLQHGSILLDFDVDLLLDVIGAASNPNAGSLRSLLKNKVGWLSQWMNPLPSTDQLIADLEQEFLQALAPRWEILPLTVGEEKVIGQLVRNIYGNSLWNQKR